MRIYGNAMPGGPLNGAHVPIPVGVVIHEPPKILAPSPLPALATGSRDYIRKWAISHGMHCYQTGALPKAVVQAYKAAIR